MDYLKAIREILLSYNLGLVKEQEALCDISEIVGTFNYRLESQIESNSEEGKKKLMLSLLEMFNA